MDNILYNEELKKCENLDDLFELWKQKHANEKHYKNTTLMEEIKPIEQNSFNKDGFINYDVYKGSNIKVLFILKEANIWAYRDKDKDIKTIIPEEREQITWYKNYIEGKDKDNRPKQHEKMGRMAYYLQNKDTDVEKAKRPTEVEFKNALKSCAFMNMNKRGGRGAATDVYYNYITLYKDFILKQIEIIEPCYIIILDSKDNEIIDSIKNQYGDKVIQMWHTANRMRGIPRKEKAEYSNDKNIDCYMEEFFKRVEESKVKTNHV